MDNVLGRLDVLRHRRTVTDATLRRGSQHPFAAIGPKALLQVRPNDRCGPLNPANDPFGTDQARIRSLRTPR